MSTPPKNYKTANPLTFGLAMAGGIGLTMMMLALGIGVARGDNADMGLISGLFIVGLLLFLTGVIGWVAAVRPFERFDDINVPQYHGHHEHASDHGQAIVVSTPDAHAVEPHGEAHS